MRDSLTVADGAIVPALAGLTRKHPSPLGRASAIA
jgi:hypothetical protein